MGMKEGGPRMRGRGRDERGRAEDEREGQG